MRNSPNVSVERRCCRTATFLALLMVWTAGHSPTAHGQSSRQERSLQLLVKRHSDLHAKFRRDMQSLADFCEAQSFLTDAEDIRRRSEPVSAGAYDLDDLPRQPLPAIPATLPDVEKEWRTKLRFLESEYARELYKLSRDALNQGHYSLAFELIREVAFHDPDHQSARGMLGRTLHEGEWLTPFEKLMRTKRYVDHPQYGWLPDKYVPRYEAGERFFNGRWITADKEAVLRSDFQYGWEIETEHFEVKTNVSLETGVDISRKLEEFQQFFVREFTPFFNTPQQMQQLFDLGSRRNGNGRRFRIHYLRTRDEFISLLKPRQSNIELANGLYMPDDRIAYFYYDKRADALETLYHEVTHQLLGESSTKSFAVATDADFWVIEGLPCYMESFNVRDDQYPIGHPRHIRIHWARRKVVEEDFFVPMRQFTALGQREFQSPATADLLHAYYSQATGMAHFFLHYQDGLYRDAFVQYLSNIYNPVERIRNNRPTLEELTGVRFETLDQQYAAYLKGLPDGIPIEPTAP